MDSQPKSLGQLARIAHDIQIGKMQLFKETDLAQIPHTTENIAHAVQAVNWLTDQTRTVLEKSTIQRGMYLCWLKTNCTQHGEWEKFCEKHFPDLPSRTRKYWMSAYLTAVGAKKPKELPQYDPDELEDNELAGEIENLSTDKARLMPRSALLETVAKQKANIERGTKQLAELNQKISTLQEELKSVSANMFIPQHVREEADRVEWIRGKFAEALQFWRQNFPDKKDSLRMHIGLHDEMSEMVQAFREEIIDKANELDGMPEEIRTGKKSKK